MATLLFVARLVTSGPDHAHDRKAYVAKIAGDQAFFDIFHSQRSLIALPRPGFLGGEPPFTARTESESAAARRLSDGCTWRARGFQVAALGR